MGFKLDTFDMRPSLCYFFHRWENGKICYSRYTYDIGMTKRFSGIRPHFVSFGSRIINRAVRDKFNHNHNRAVIKLKERSDTLHISDF